VELQLRRVAAMAEELGVELEVTSAAEEIILQEGYDPAFGARPLKRAIQRLVQDPLALHLLETEIEEGTVIRVEAGKTPGTLSFVALGPEERTRGSGDSGETGSPVPGPEKATGVTG
jgi:ATP-dependent Clp protease ATP-binding subunit ClpB